MFFSFQLCSVDDHHQEVIGFCRDNSFHGILAEEAEYAIFDPPRYFSSKQLKLTYKVRHPAIFCLAHGLIVLFISFYRVLWKPKNSYWMK